MQRLNGRDACYCRQSVLRLQQQLSVHDRTVEGVVGLGTAPVVSDPLGDGVFIEFDSQTRSPRQFDIDVADLEWLLQVALAQTDVFLA